MTNSSNTITISEYCKDHLLLIPEGLHDFKDAAPIMNHGTAGIFHKLVHEDTMYVEFFTNAPCIVYVTRGRENFFDPDGTEIITGPGDILLIPRHHHMVSNFANKSGPLEAWLFFFSDTVIKDFLKFRSPYALNGFDSRPALLETNAKTSARLPSFIDALTSVYGGLKPPFSLTKTKLVELLLLLDMESADGQFHKFLINQNLDHARRNIKQVMRQNADLDLSVAEYARLSGRSVSAFQRDFKREFGISPGSWLRESKLERSHELIVTSQESVSEIAHRIGYADTSHFIKAFKAQFGCTPKQMRQRVI